MIPYWTDAQPSVPDANQPPAAPARDRWPAAFTQLIGAMNDARKLTFPLRDVILIAVGAVTVSGAVWTAETGLRNQVQSVSDKMDLQQKLDDERLEHMRETISDMRKRQELTEIEVRDLKEIVIRIEAQKGR